MQNQKFFFSYSRHDTDLVKKLADDLKKAGANVWLDQQDIPVGENWDTAIQHALNEASGVLLVLSSTSVQSQNVLDEASFALDQGKRIIPLLIEPCEVPFRFARKQYIDFMTDYSLGLQSLLQTLANKDKPADLSGGPSFNNKRGMLSFWSSMPMKLGVVSTILGIALSSAAAFKFFNPGEKEHAAEKEAILKNKELPPRIEASYMIIDLGSPYYFEEKDSTDRKNQLYFLDYPLLQNEIEFDNKTDEKPEAAIFDDTLPTRIVYLVLQNMGKATPENVQVILKRYQIKDKVTLEEMPGATNTGYETKIHAKTTDSSVRTFNPPTTLETGKGIRAPLFVASDYYNVQPNGKKNWNILSKIVYIPYKVIYTDPLDNEKKEISIRPMKDPVKIASGVEGRG